MPILTMLLYCPIYAVKFIGMLSPKCEIYLLRNNTARAKTIQYTPVFGQRVEGGGHNWEIRRRGTDHFHWQWNWKKGLASYLSVHSVQSAAGLRTWRKWNGESNRYVGDIDSQLTEITHWLTHMKSKAVATTKVERTRRNSDKITNIKDDTTNKRYNLLAATQQLDKKVIWNYWPLERHIAVETKQDICLR